MTTSTPEVRTRPDTPYVGSRHTVPMSGFAPVIDAGFPKLFAHLDAAGVEPASPPFIAYERIDMESTLDIVLGVPVTAEDSAALQGDGEVFVGLMSGGAYATLVHTGPFDGLIDANAELQRWAAENDLHFMVDGDRWTGRLEIYVTDPSSEPDPTKWVTEVSYLLAG